MTKISFKKFLLSFFILTLLFLLGGCKTNESFNEFTNHIFINEITANGLNLHYTLSEPDAYGIEDYSVSLGELSTSGLHKSYAKLENYEKVLNGFRYKSLTKDQQLTYDILDYYFTTELSASDLSLYTELLSPVIGTQAQLPVLFAEYTFSDRDDVENYFLLLSQLDRYYESILDFEKEKSNEGLFMGDAAAESIISQCQSFINQKEENYLLTVFSEKLNGIESLTDGEKSDYITRNEEIVHNHVIPAYETLIYGLDSLKGTGKNQEGLCYFKDGKEYYEYLVKSGTGSSRSIKELQELAKNKMISDLQNISQVLTENPTVLTSIDSYSFELNEPMEILKDLETKIQKDFPAPPDTSYTVKYVDESLSDYLSPAFYLTPPLDNMSENVIYINPANPYTKIELYTTLAHEGYPGHLYQTIYSSTSGHDNVRSLLNFPGYSEGWATYVEMESYYLSGLDYPLARLLQLNNSLTLGLYAEIDMGIHYDGWSLFDTEDYLESYGITDKNAAKEVFCAIVAEPANYLKYYIGYLEFLSLREDAENRLGENFAAIDFHEFLLSLGPAPFPVIEKYLDLWIDEYQ